MEEAIGTQKNLRIHLQCTWYDLGPRACTKKLRDVRTWPGLMHEHGLKRGLAYPPESTVTRSTVVQKKEIFLARNYRNGPTAFYIKIQLIGIFKFESHSIQRSATRRAEVASFVLTRAVLLLTTIFREDKTRPFDC